MSDEMKFTEDDLHLAAFKLASENNALLRLLLGNQQRIMDKLGLSQELNDGLVRDLHFLDTSREKDPRKQLESDTLYEVVKAAESLSDLVRERSIEWGRENAKNIAPHPWVTKNSEQ